MDEEPAVRVRAVVMTRDDSSGGWVPLGGPGLSYVSLLPTGPGSSSLIRGERLRDQAVILECPLTRDLVYNKVNPIFHHWRVGDHKFGLTFQSPADAATFERSVHTAVEETAEGSLTSTSPSSRSQGETDAAEGKTATHTDSESSPNSRKGDDPQTYHRGDQRVLPPAAAPTPPPPPPDPTLWLSLGESSAHTHRGYEDYRRAAGERGDLCVRFAKGPGGEGREGSEGAVGQGAEAVGGSGGPSSPSLGTDKLKRGWGEEPAHCVYCGDVFVRGENGRGRCQDAPDPGGHCVHRLSCMWCAESLLYHCMSDSEGDYSDPCSCEPAGRPLCARWLALAALSLLAPCMCCYLPLHACHRCGLHWGCCGGRHKATR
ncbi:sprouty-related, EVH1 domain-containing protein 3 [Leucoraja erinacea]|uniref:sprouty-related, EVH1 domain-containing protein 3 n=1 Tax=Leucoraja erinaceus TaxID=7782 RepID=UPI002454FAED|nr:sprouty-related, EVH1 domain-containing protein 3 [Leucoraja erinacea]